MGRLRENRGVILRAGVVLVLAATAPAAFTVVKASLVQKAVQSGIEAASPAEEQILAEREAAHALLRAGEAEAGAEALLASLRTLPADATDLLEAAHGSLQLLAFAMVGLMRDDALEAFEAQLDPALWPMDALVSVYYYREVEDYARWRDLPLFSGPEMWARLDAVCASPSPLVRAGGLLQAASPYLWTRIAPAEVARILEATNDLGALMPDSRLLREVVREHVRACLGPGFHPLPDVQALFGALAGGEEAEAAEAAAQADLAQAVPLQHGAAAIGAMAELLPWAPAVAAVLADDPVVALATEAAGAAAQAEPGTDEEAVRQACLDLVVDEALNHADAGVRDWCLRSMVLTDGMLHGLASAQEAATVRGACAQRVDALPPPEGRAPPDGARAAVNLLQVAAERDVALDGTDGLQSVALAPRRVEPIDMNLFEQAPRRLAHYGYSLARQGSHAEAATVFEDLAALYPDSVLGDKWQADADHLRRVLERLARAGGD